MELPCFLYDPANVGNFISGSSGFSKSNLNIWKFSVHVILKLSLENFEHYFASMWDKCNGVVIWTPKNKISQCFHFPLLFAPLFEVMGPDAMILVFWMLSFKPAFSLSFSLASRVSTVPLLFLPLGWCHLHIWGYWYFSWQSWFLLVHHPALHSSWCALHRS